jgi:hypothetical protein
MLLNFVPYIKSAFWYGTILEQGTSEGIAGRSCDFFSFFLAKVK